MSSDSTEKVTSSMDKLSVSSSNDKNDSSSSTKGQPGSQECSLYVGDLPPDVTEGHLYGLFSEFGSIKSIRVVKDNLTRRSLGYAFVNFNHADGAQNALDNDTPKVLHDRTLRVMPYQRDPALQKLNSSGNVFIKNLDPAIDSEALGDTFSAFGKVVSCKIATDEFGVPRGFGYVLFENPQHAEDAINRMNGVLMNDRPVTVSHHIPKRELINKMEELKANYTNLYVKNIAPDVSEEEFEQLFAQYGEVESYSLPLDNESKSRGFGFVNFHSHEQAVQAVEKLNGTQFHDKRLYVSRAQKKYERMEELRQKQEVNRIERLAKYQGTNLYIKYLDESIDDEQLKQAFEPYGTITSAKIMTDDKGQSRGFGFVCFTNAEEAQRAIAEMHQSELKGNKIYVNLAQRKDRKQNHHHQQHYQHPNMIMSPRMPYGFMPPPPPAATGFKNPYMRPFIPGGAQGQAAPPPPPPQAAAGAPATAPFGAFYYPIQQVATPRPKKHNDNRRGNGSNNYMNNNNISSSHNNNSNNNNSNNNTSHPLNANAGQRGGMRNSNQKVNGTKNNQPPFGSTLSAAVASASTEEAGKQIIGEALYPKVRDHPVVSQNQDLAGKITGMLLEQNTDALLKWFDDDHVLNKSIQQAYDAYMEYLDKK